MKSSSYDVANTVCGKQKLSAFLRVESSVLFEFWSELNGFKSKSEAIKN